MTRSTIVHHMTVCPHTIGVDQTLATAQRFMREHRIRHLPVLDRKMVVGVLSQRDVYFLETINGVVPSEVKVEEAMSQAPYVVDADTPLERVAREMAKHRYGCAVVAEHGEVIGLFTTTDALRVLSNLLAERQRATPAARKARKRSAS